ncbi:MAG: NAD(P)/FAD-dependent oxidoreductase [Alphaproteobacteria bacterium]
MTNISNSTNSSHDYKFVIIGAGPAGVVAAETLSDHGAGGSILLIGGENEPPYSRMAIPYLLVENIDEAGTYLRKEDHYYESKGIDIIHSRVMKTDAAAKTLTLDNGNVIAYEKLCVATGSHPIKPPIQGLDLPNIHHCWTLEDSRNIAQRATKGAKVVLMGAGFIGCIILEALAERDVHLTVVEMGDRMVPRMLDSTCGNLIKTWCAQKGVDVETSTKINQVKQGKNGLEIDLDNGSTLEADLLVVAAGVKPNADCVADTGIKIAQGIHVDDYMESSVPDIYAIGDVAEVRDFSIDQWSVHAIQPVAVDHARIAALNMLGKRTKYQGSLGLNVLDTLGLISASFGKWDGVEGGQQAIRLDADQFRYTRLEFQDDVLIGAQTLGRTDHIGVIRGLIQNRIPLGEWKDKLIEDPNLIMNAYVDITHV